MSTAHVPRWLPGAILLILLLGATFPSLAAPAGLDPRLVEYLANAPGGQGSFLVFLKEQADLTGAPLIAGRTARVTYVYEALRSTAERTQAGLRADLAAWGVPYRAFYIVNAIRVTGDLALARRLAGRPEVARLVADPPFHGIDDPPGSPPAPPAVDAVEWNVARVHAPDVWALGYTGQGIVVGSVDTGVEYTHPALVNQYRGNLGGGNYDHNYNWAEPDGTSVEPYDPNGHGTHTTGTMVGDDGGANQVGVAPGAQWIACKVDSNGVWHASKYIACWEWMLAPTDLNGQNPRPDLAAHVVNNSWSCPESEGCTPDTLLPAAQALYAAGIAIAKSGGNAGSNCSTITNPGQYKELLATGAFNSSNIIAGFSSRGPSIYQGETRVKPDIAAPGVGVRSSYPGGGYSTLQGTSMASPHTAGVIALLWSARPDLLGDPEKTYQVIKATAEPKIDAQCPPYVGHPNDVWGWGILNVLAAVQSGRLRGTVYDSAFTPLPGTTVQVAPVGGGPVRQTIADANAVYSFTLQAGDYLITATLPGYFPTTGTVAVATALTTVHDIVLEPLPPCEPVQGADFDWTPLTPTVGQTVTFSGTAWAGGVPPTPPITYTWDLGDGTLLAGEVVAHAYAQPGLYTVALTATNCGTATATVAHTLTVLPPPCAPPTMTDFVWTPVEPMRGAVVTFTASATGTAPLLYEWAFGDGMTGTGMIVEHAYGADGLYTVTVVVSNACGVGGADHQVLVATPEIVPPYPVPPVGLYPGGQAYNSFTIANAGNADLEWSLAEAPDAPWLEESTVSGVIAPGASADVQITYTAPLTPGLYTTVLRIASNDPISPAVDVLVEMQVATPCVRVEIEAVTPTIAGCAVTFTAALQGEPPFAYLWGFGDGITSTEAMPTHLYAASGVYSATLFVENCGGDGYDEAYFAVAVDCAVTPTFKIYLPLVVKE